MPACTIGYYVLLCNSGFLMNSASIFYEPIAPERLDVAANSGARGRAKTQSQPFKFKGVGAIESNVVKTRENIPPQRAEKRGGKAIPHSWRFCEKRRRIRPKPVDVTG